MAEKLTTIDFSKLTNKSTVKASDWPDGGVIDYAVEGGEGQSFTIPAATGDKTITIPGVGTFTATADSTASFVADADLDGEVTVKGSAGASVTSVDFSKTTGGIKYTVDTDDTSVILGLGADTISIDGAKNVTAVNNYSYTTSDVIKTSVTSAGTLTNAGVFTIGTDKEHATVNVNTDGTQIYKAKVTQDKANYEYWTAVKDGTAKDFDASALSSDTMLVLDAKNTTDANVTLGKGTSSVSIASGKVASGAGNDTINATGALTLSIGRNDGNDSIASSIKAGDTVIFEGGRLSQISINATNADLTFGNTTVHGIAKDAGNASIFSAQFGTDATAGKLQWGDTITAATDTVYFLGTKDGGSSLGAAKNVAVDWNLGDSTKFNNIHFVSLQAGNSGSVTFSNSGDTLVAGSDTKAISLTLGQGNDSVSLGTNDKQDTITTGAVSGQDTIEGFKTGFDGDILSLSNVSSLDDLYVGKGYASMVAFDKKKENYVSLKSATAFKDDGLLIKLSGNDTVQKVAADLDGDGTITVNGTSADVVLGAKDGKTLYSVKGGADTDVNIINFADTAKYKNLSQFDLSSLAGAQLITGTSENGDKITLGTGAAAVWGGGSESDAITLNSAMERKGDIVWFSASDGSDTVTNFKSAKDSVFFWGAASTTDIAKNYTFAKDGLNNVTITNKHDKHDVLTLSSFDSGNTLTVTNNSLLKSDATTAETTTKVSFAGTGASTASFTTDSLIYVGTADKAAVSVGAGAADDDGLFVSMDLRGDGADLTAGTYNARGYDVKSFDASKSYASYLLIGSGESTLKGGHTANAFWGSTDGESQTFVGNADATDYFWIGKGDGNDIAQTVGSEDVVYLWNTTIDAIKVTVKDSGDVNVVIDNDNSLTIENGVAALKSGLTFQTNDNKTYTYDTKNQQFVAKA